MKIVLRIWSISIVALWDFIWSSLWEQLIFGILVLDNLFISANFRSFFAWACQTVNEFNILWTQKKKLKKKKSCFFFITKVNRWLFLTIWLAWNLTLNPTPVKTLQGWLLCQEKKKRTKQNKRQKTKTKQNKAMCFCFCIMEIYFFIGARNSLFFQTGSC